MNDERTDEMMSQGLAVPVSVWTVSDELRRVVAGWVQADGQMKELRTERPPNGTLLLRTDGPWDSLIGFGSHQDGNFSPGLLFKNPIPLWQSTTALQNGRITTQGWPTLRRTILIHNPGLNGVLHLLDEAVGTSSSR